MIGEHTEVKRLFYRGLVTNGVASYDELSTLYPMGWKYPDHVVHTWLERFYRLPKSCSCPVEARLVNRFLVGADPEFYFTRDRGEGTEPIYAEKLGLKAGQAFGADNNGRLVEIRPHPSRFQVEVLASILSTMRWLAALTASAQYDWQTGAYMFKDGLGGHVHVGRKRLKSQRTEVNGLDKLTLELESLGCYPKKEVERRRAGDQFGQLYGQLSDVRKQPYGYEYRTFPSWLCNPWFAYLHLVLAKLAVHDPELFDCRKQTTQHIRNLLLYFQGSDDDARLALLALKRLGLPSHTTGDFRMAWGLLDVPRRTDVLFVPSSIKPSKSDCAEVWNYLAEGSSLQRKHLPEPSWSPIAPPKGFRMLITDVNTHGQKGLGELLYDLVTLDESKFSVYGIGDRHKYFRVGPTLDLHPNWRTLVPIEAREDGPEPGFGINARHKPEDVRKHLLSGAFPVWDIRTVNAESRKTWTEALKLAPVKKSDGRVGEITIYK